MSGPTTRKEWQRWYGQYLSKVRAPNGDFQIRPDLLSEVVERLVIERRGLRALLRRNDAMFGQTRMEVVGEFLDEARAAFEALEAPDKVRGYRDPHT